jgi:hypothetical protein
MENMNNDFCVPDNRDLHCGPTGSNFNPRNTTHMPAVIFFACLDIEQKDHLWMDNN